MKSAPRHPDVRWGAALAAIFLTALAFRLSFVARLSASPLGGALEADARAYWEWASVLLRDRWLGHEPFFLGPLYPYALALLRTLGLGLHGVLVAQAVLGSASVVLLADSARRLTSTRVGIMVGLLLAGYAMLVFLDGQILMESTLVFLEALVIWLLSRLSWTAPSMRTFAMVGLAIGIAAQGRAIALALVIPLGYALATRVTDSRVRGRALAVILACALLPAVPTTLRHATMFGVFMPFTYSAGYNLHVGNHPGATGSFAPITDFADMAEPETPLRDGGVDGDGRGWIRRTEGMTLSPAESSRFWMSRALRFIATQPVAAATLYVRKCLMILNWREYAQVSSLAVTEQMVGPIGWPWVGTYLMLWVLAVIGIGSVWRHPVGSFALGAVAITTLAFAAMFVTDRYRIHLVPFLAMLAACGIERLWRVRSQALGRLAVPAAAGLAIAFVPLDGYSSQRREWDLWSERGRVAFEAGRPAEATAHLTRAIALDARGIEGANSPEGRLGRSGVYALYGEVLASTGDVQGAVRAFECADTLAPGVPHVVRELGCAYARNGSLDRAASLFRSIGLSGPDAARVLLARARLVAGVPGSPGLGALLHAATTLDPSSEAAWVALARWHIQEGRRGAARGALDRAEAHGIRREVIRAHRALIAAIDGSSSYALRLLSEISPASADDPSLEPVIRATRSAIANSKSHLASSE